MEESRFSITRTSGDACMIMRFTPSKTSICSSSSIPIPAFTALETLIIPTLSNCGTPCLKKE